MLRWIHFYILRSNKTVKILSLDVNASGCFIWLCAELATHPWCRPASGWAPADPCDLFLRNEWVEEDEWINEYLAPCLQPVVKIKADNCVVVDSNPLVSWAISDPVPFVASHQPSFDIVSLPVKKVISINLQMHRCFIIHLLQNSSFRSLLRR